VGAFLGFMFTVLKLDDSKVSCFENRHVKSGVLPKYFYSVANVNLQNLTSLTVVYWNYNPRAFGSLVQPLKNFTIFLSCYEPYFLQEINNAFAIVESHQPTVSRILDLEESSVSDLESSSSLAYSGGRKTGRCIYFNTLVADLSFSIFNQVSFRTSKSNFVKAWKYCRINLGLSRNRASNCSSVSKETIFAISSYRLNKESLRVFPYPHAIISIAAESKPSGLSRTNTLKSAGKTDFPARLNANLPMAIGLAVLGILEYIISKRVVYKNTAVKNGVAA